MPITAYFNPRKPEAIDRYAIPRYARPADYDPVLRAHCRLDEPSPPDETKPRDPAAPSDSR